MVEVQELDASELAEIWPFTPPDERLEGFALLDRPDAEDFFLDLSARDQAELLLGLPPAQRRSWIRLLAPDDVADLIQEAPPDERDALLALLDEPTRKEVSVLLAYAEDEAGGLMSPRFARIRPEMSIDEAIGYLRRQAGRVETLYYAYVLDHEQRLLGVVSFRDLFSAPGNRVVVEVMETDVVAVHEEMDQESVARLFAEHDLVAIPVLDAERRMKGIVTIDDIVDVVEEETTEDIHKMGGTAALEAPYLQTGLGELIRKRAGWLSVLFIGETFTATAISFFQDQIAQAVVLVLFLPLIISSGGNSGSQASTLVIRAMAVGEVRLRDWWRVVRRELAMGIALGSVLGLLGLARIVMGELALGGYGEYFLLVGATVALSLVGVVLFGTIVGSMLPFLLRRLGFDPASASAPLIATLVDVTGLIIYFTTATLLLGGRLL